MLTANRRHRMLFVGLAGMDVAASLPYILALLARPLPGAPDVLPDGLPARLAGAGWAGWLLAFLFFWAVLLGYLLAADLLNRWGVESPRRDLLLAALVLATALLGAWLLLPGGLPARPPRDLLAALVAFGPGVRPALLLFAYHLFLWWRTAAMTSRDLGFFSVGVSFRLGMLVALVGNGLLALRGGPPYPGAAAAAGLFWAFFACGLTAAALARMDDEALMAGDSTGALLPWGRFGQLLAAVAATLGAGALFAVVWSPGGFGRVLGWLEPVTGLLFRLLQLLLVALIWLMTPAMWLLERLLRGLRSGQEVQEAPPAAQPLAQNELADFAGFALAWPWLRTGLIVAGVLLALALIWLFFVRTQPQPRRDEPEEAAPDEIAPTEAGDSTGRWRLGRLLGLVRRYGVGQRLLAAISVQNIYANVSRLAAQRGYARPPALSPDDYLPRLARAFPGEAARLERLTDAYLRVHYGDEPASAQELALLRADYAALREEPGKAAG